MLAGVTNPIAEMLRDSTVDVDFTFGATGSGADAEMIVRPLAPPGVAVTERQFLFREAFWDDAFPPPPPGHVVTWISRSLRRQIPAVVKGWWQDPIVDEHGHQDADDYVFVARSLPGRLSFLLIGLLSLIAALPLIVIGTVAGLVLYPLASLPGLNKLGLAWLNNTIQSSINHAGDGQRGLGLERAPAVRRAGAAADP
jgi:hypothetical protein